MGQHLDLANAEPRKLPAWKGQSGPAKADFKTSHRFSQPSETEPLSGKLESPKFRIDAWRIKIKVQDDDFEAELRHPNARRSWRPKFQARDLVIRH
jgi:hypothetical protein